MSACDTLCQPTAVTGSVEAAAALLFGDRDVVLPTAAAPARGKASSPMREAIVRDASASPIGAKPLLRPLRQRYL